MYSNFGPWSFGGLRFPSGGVGPFGYPEKRVDRSFLMSLAESDLFLIENAKLYIGTRSEAVSNTAIMATGILMLTQGIKNGSSDLMEGLLQMHLFQF